ncbi:MAG: folylpolyglutamate synthase/dihydrofolate synthase family protein, partial [Moraxella sp.]|nr:folylpolyglutamate synthase/dihydrofolate synthase family protein [Moraxella sp.]
MPNTITTPSTLSEWLDYMGNIHVSAIDMGLERVLPVADKLGVLAHQLADKPYIFTVAGTNGKGSTTTAIARMCEASGLKTALYQSPHLVSFNERMCIDGVMIDDDTLMAAFAQVETVRVACGLSLSFFEMTTLAAFWVFKQAQCDVWVLEIGLGGRLDVVNIITPDMCVITNVDIDHTDWLGDDREKIGYEKAGILRKHGTLIYGERDMPSSVQDEIERKQATCYQLGQAYTYLDNGADWVYSCAAHTLRLPKPAISLINASTAVSAVLASSLNITQDDIAKGLHKVALAGRFDKRVIDGRQWLFDVGHNEHGVRFLLGQFVPYWQDFAKRYANGQLYIVFSMLADKDVDKVLSLMAGANLPIKSWHIGTIDNVRAMQAGVLADKVQAHLPNANI